MAQRETVDPRFTMREGPDGPEAVESASYAEERLIEDRRRRYRLAGVEGPDLTYRGPDAAGNMPKLRKYVAEFRERYRSLSLYLWSERNATQKTTVARSLARRLIDDGLTARFVLMGTLARALTRRGFPDEDKILLKDAEAVDFLVIDDAFDPKKVTVYRSGYQIAFLDEFLRQRLEGARRAICFTSNIAPEAIPDEFGPSLRSLVRRSAPDPMRMDDQIEDFSVEDLWT